MPTINETHLFRLHTLQGLEKAGEIAAVTYLTRLWKYEHLHTRSGGLLKAFQGEIAHVREQILEDDLDLYIQRNQALWSLVLRDGMNITDFANRFGQEGHALDTPYRNIIEAIEYRVKQAKEPSDEEA